MSKHIPIPDDIQQGLKASFGRLDAESKEPSEEPATGTAYFRRPEKPNEEIASKIVNQQTSIEEKEHTSKDEKKQSNIQVNKPSSKEEYEHSSIPLKKFASYIPGDVYKKWKIEAAKRGIKDYEILTEALKKYLK